MNAEFLRNTRKVKQSTLCYWPLLTLVVSLSALGAVYQLGLPGGFLFDDKTNLEALGAHGTINSWALVDRYLESAAAGPTGRPISMLSFLLNRDSWPSDPGAFKKINIVIHLLNASLLFCFLALLFQASPKVTNKENILWVAALSTLWWATHPLHVSTVLYVIQRMTELSALFSLLGMIGFVVGRKAILEGSRLGYPILIGSLISCTFLATLSKENGALLPILLLIIDSLFFTTETEDRTWLRLRTILLKLPSLAIIGYLLWVGFTKYTHATILKGFSLSERLITELAVLADYLYLLLIPRALTHGLYQEIPVRDSIFDDAQVLAGMMLTVFLLIIAWAFRKKHPLASFSILFFFAAHLIESTTVPLDLYYEHRNYLPSLVLFVPLAAWISNGLSKKKISPAWGILPVALILLSLTAIRATSWSAPQELQLRWAESNPQSLRAQLAAIEFLSTEPDHKTAVVLLKNALNTVEDKLVIQLHLLRLKQLEDKELAIELGRLFPLVHNARYSNELMVAAFMLSDSITQTQKPESTRMLLRLWEAFSENDTLTENTRIHAKIIHYEGKAELFMEQPAKALILFQHALHTHLSPDMGIVQTTLLATRGHYCEASSHLRMVRDLTLSSNNLSDYSEYYTGEIDRLSAVLREDTSTAGLECPK